jgi:hypothetical protein
MADGFERTAMLQGQGGNYRGVLRIGFGSAPDLGSVYEYFGDAAVVEPTDATGVEPPIIKEFINKPKNITATAALPMNFMECNPLKGHALTLAVARTRLRRAFLPTVPAIGAGWSISSPSQNVAFINSLGFWRILSRRTNTGLSLETAF